MSKAPHKTVRLLDAYTAFHKNELPPISPRTRNKDMNQRYGGTFSPNKYSKNFPGKRLYPEPKPKTTLDSEKEDKTGILTILKETKNEIVDQIKELYSEKDPELFLQYAKSVSNLHPKLYVFDLYPTKPPEPGNSESPQNNSETTSIASTKLQTKVAQKYLRRIKDRFKQVREYVYSCIEQS